MFIFESEIQELKFAVDRMSPTLARLNNKEKKNKQIPQFEKESYIINSSIIRTK